MQRAPVSFAATRIPAGQPAAPVHDALPRYMVAAGVGDPADLARRPGPAGQPGHLSVRHYPALGHRLDYGVHAVHEGSPRGHCSLVRPVRVFVALALQIRRIGHVGHAGARAVHTVAPKSINA